MSIPELVAVVGSCVGGVWVLRSKLSDIEKAVVGHVERDDERHKNHEGRLIRLEDWKDQKGRR